MSYTRFGGHIADVPKPYKRMFADKRRKRTSSLTILQGRSGFIGVGIDLRKTVTKKIQRFMRQYQQDLFGRSRRREYQRWKGFHNDTPSALRNRLWKIE